jgi:hypothetical protein
MFTLYFWNGITTGDVPINSSRMKIFIAFFLTGLLLIGCNSVPEPAAIVVLTQSTATQKATSVPEFTQFPVASPTDIQLPFNPDAGVNEYCKPPYAILPVQDGKDISEDEIVYELVKIWLRRYKQPEVPAFCRIADYSIDKIYDDPGIYSKVLEPRGDFKRVVVFSVKLIQVPSEWMSFAGELDQENWLHTSHIVAITKTNEGYKLEFANP